MKMPQAQVRVFCVELKNARPGSNVAVLMDAKAWRYAAGLRHFPERVNNTQPARREGFSLKSSRECYSEFPTQVRASFPLHVPPAAAAEPAGFVAKQQPDAGPLTGHRRPPSLRDKLQHRKPAAAVLPEPDPQLLLEVATRKGC